MPRKATGLRRRYKLLVYFDEDEKTFLDLQAFHIGMSMNEYVRRRCFPYGWRKKLSDIKRSQKKNDTIKPA